MRYAIMFCALLAGCASQVGWTKKYEVVAANSKGITIEYDTILSSMKEISAVAAEHCAKFGREAVPEGNKSGKYESVWGGVYDFAFRCE